jgi:large subunit ribosomal protein L24
MSKTHVKKGDQVQVIAGSHKGKTGTVTLVNAAKNTVIVEGVRSVTKAIRRSEQEPDGGLKTIDGSIHISNVKKLG